MAEDMNKCLTTEQVERYGADDCPEAEQRAVEEHIKRCQRCRQRIESAQSSTTATENCDSDSVGSHGGGKLMDRDGSIGSGTPRPKLSLPDVSSQSFDAGCPREVSDITFEGYQIIEELPRGGQAVVYKAIHKATKTKVALKVLLPGLVASAKARRYFEQEVELAAHLNHPNIVSIRDSGVAQGQYYFAMEYIHGQPLHRYVGSQQLCFREKIILFNKICDAITHAHQRGVIHRDLKPSNILVDEGGEPHVLDFGLAKTATGLSTASESTDMQTVTGQIIGTTAYMSPEQAAGRSDLIDVRSDVYALGVILYEMLVGRLPYDISGTAVETLDNIQHADPVRPRKIISKFDSDVEAILLKALEKRPNRRYQSAAELRQDIRCWLDGAPIFAKSVSSWYLLRKIATRHWHASAVVGLIVLIILGFSGVSLSLLVRAREAEQQAKDTLDDWSRQADNVYDKQGQFGFILFLEAWREGKDQEAGMIAGFLGKGSKEKEGAMFLLDSRLLAEKEADFRKKLADKPGWFADFVIGEQHLKNGYQKQGLDAYNRSYAAVQQSSQSVQSISDGLLVGHVKARLYDLTVSHKSRENVPIGMKED